MRKVNRADYEDGSEGDAEYEYIKRKQELQLQELKRYHIHALLIDDYTDITEILHQIENSYKAGTIFISGSAEEYGTITKDEAQGFIHKLSKSIIQSKYRIVNGFGWGVGSAVINGALEAIYDKSSKYSQSQLILRPFPQFETGRKTKQELWQEYREKMISLSGIALFVFGNKFKEGTKDIENAGGVHKEFEIAKSNGCHIIPIGMTGYMAKELWEELMTNFQTYYPDNENLKDEFQKLGDSNLSFDEIIKIVDKILNTLKK